MGLFDKNETCSICGANKSFLGVTAVADGKICDDCAKKLSNQFKLNKKMMVADVAVHLQYREENEKCFAVFSATDKAGNFILADKNTKKFYIPATTSLGKTPDLFDFNQLVDYELLEDGETLTSKKVSLGKAAVGTVLLGPVGTIVGGLSGKSKTKSTCTSMSIRISINSPLYNQIEIPLITKEVKKNSFTYKAAKDNANHIISLLDIISDIAEKETPIPVTVQETSSSSIADELSKMKGLLDAGVITQEDFDNFKKKILG